MKALIQRTLEVAFILALVYLLAGCSTIGGIGQDLVWVGSHQPTLQAQD